MIDKQIDNAIKNFILKKGGEGNSAESIRWFREFVTKSFSRFGAKQAMTTGKMTTQIRPGFLYMYSYDPKFKDKMPYYDRFPLILCIDVTKDGWTGINLHYMPPKIREAIFSELLDTLNKPNLDERTKFKVTWAKLKSFSHNAYIKHACKKYLYSQLETPFCKVDPKYWEIVIFLPVAKFEKATTKQVWRDI